MGRPLESDLTGLRVGRLVVLQREGSKSGQPLWRCRCDCGQEVLRYGNGLRRGSSKSCGCLVADTNRALRLTHGQTRTRTWRIWIKMRERCGNPNAINFDRYGGRGIKVCDRWRESFEAFRADMGDPPSDGHSIDRIDMNGNYEPGNCRWATHREQRLNSRRKEYGEKHPLAKLTNDDVRAIRLSKLSNAKLAEAYGLSSRNVWAIRTKRSWKSVT